MLVAETWEGNTYSNLEQFVVDESLGLRFGAVELSFGVGEELCV